MEGIEILQTDLMSQMRALITSRHDGSEWHYDPRCARSRRPRAASLRVVSLTHIRYLADRCKMESCP